MAQQFKLQDPGEGIHEAEIIEVLVSAGDEVEEGQDILVIETDKASMELPSPYTGTVKEVNVRKGDIVNVGDVLVTFEGDGDEGEELEEAESRAASEAASPAKAEAGGRSDASSGDEEGAADTAPPSVRGTREAESGRRAETAGDLHGRGPIPAAPSTRRVARELEVDLRAVTPSGPGGRVTEADVRAHAEGGGPAAQEPQERGAPLVAPGAPSEVPALPEFERWGEVEREPLRSVRRATARRMALAWSQIPHVAHHDTADITELEQLRRRHADEAARRGGKLTLTVFVLKALVAALRQHPRFNASLDTERGEIIVKRYYNIGVATDTGRGLVVPVVRDVDRKSVTELAVEFYDIAEKARRGDLEREDMAGGSMTVTNIGPLGGTGLSPIINWPEVAILGLAQARMEPVVSGSTEDFEVRPRLVLPISLVFDHRVNDGADAARFAGVIKDVLSDPEELTLMM